jgi:16S rRNA processing protein RimM
VHGEIIMDLHTDFPDRLQPGRAVYLGDARRPAGIASVRPHGTGMLIRFDGIETPEAAGELRNSWVFVARRDVPDLPDGQLYQHQLFGLDVVDVRGARLGSLTEIIETGANDVYVVTDELGREILLPAIPTVILEVDPGRRTMRVHVPDGLIPDDPPST